MVYIRVLCYVRIVFVSLVLLISFVKPDQALSQAQLPSDTTMREILTRAYSLLRANPSDAERLFARALLIDPSNDLVRKQLAYLYLAGEQNELALEQFRVADSLHPSDSTKLQIGYTLLNLNRRKEAEGVFKGLQTSQYADIRDRASDQFDLLVPNTAAWWTRIYAAPFYDTRWNTSFYQSVFQEGYYVTRDRTISGFGFASYSGDARSSGGLSPSIFSDNAIIVGVGIRTTPFTGFQFNVQQGVAFDLIEKGSTDRQVRGDFRAVAVYGNGIYAPYTLHNDLRMPFHPFADLYTSAGYYSRYKNGIGYLQGKVGVRPIEISRTVFDLYCLGALVWDTEKLYYNNILEGGLAARLIPNVQWGLSFVGELRRGYYIDVSSMPLPYDRYYGTFRLFLIFDRTF